MTEGCQWLTKINLDVKNQKNYNMARVLIVSDNEVVQAMTAANLPVLDKGKHKIAYARSSGSMHRILEEDDQFDCIILTDMLEGVEGWRDALGRITPREKKVTIVFFTELGQHMAERLSDKKVFGYAYGRAPKESPESLASQSSKLLG